MTTALNEIAEAQVMLAHGGGGKLSQILKQLIEERDSSISV